MGDLGKFKRLVHYVCAQRAKDPASLGAVKLNKILWMSEIRAFYELGHAITTARYIKRQFGPVPAAILATIRSLEQSRVLTVREAPHFGKQKKEYVVYMPADSSFMSDAERAIVDRTIDYVCDEHTATSVSEASHDHIWKAAADGEEIPHFTVFARPGKIMNVDREWAQIKLESVMA